MFVDDSASNTAINVAIGVAVIFAVVFILGLLCGLLGLILPGGLLEASLQQGIALLA